MVFLGGKWARGGLYERVSEKFWAKNGRDRLHLRKNSPEKRQFLHMWLSDFLQTYCVHCSNSLLQVWVLTNFAPSLVWGDNVTFLVKKWKFRHFGVRFFHISPLTVEFGKNDLLHFFIARQLGATCKFSGISNGQFSRSCMDRGYVQ